MESILGILFNLFEGADLGAILDSVDGSLATYGVEVIFDTFTSFFGGLFS